MRLLCPHATTAVAGMESVGMERVFANAIRTTAPSLIVQWVHKLAKCVLQIAPGMEIVSMGNAFATWDFMGVIVRVFLSSV